MYLYKKIVFTPVRRRAAPLNLAHGRILRVCSPRGGGGEGVYQLCRCKKTPSHRRKGLIYVRARFHPCTKKSTAAAYYHVGLVCTTWYPASARDPYFVPFIYRTPSHLRCLLGSREKLSSEAVEESESGPAPTSAASEAVVDPEIRPNAS